MSDALLHGDITHEIIGAFYDTYNALGWGYPESIYANAIPIFLVKRGLSYIREVPLRVTLEGDLLGEFRADMVVADKVILELKACERIIAAHEAQLISYLKASGYSVGLLLNFGPKAELRRIIWTDACACSKIANSWNTEGTDCTDNQKLDEKHDQELLFIVVGLSVCSVQSVPSVFQQLQSPLPLPFAYTCPPFSLIYENTEPCASSATFMLP